MKIVGILSWYDEAPHWLSTAVSGFARVVDQIVAVDGAYALLPGARPCSHPQQAEAVLAAAEAGGVACLVHRPNRLFFGNEVEKRNLTLQLAAPFLAEDDWVLVFDADCHLFKVNPEVVRGRLENTDAMIASYTYLQVENFLINEEMARIFRDDDYDYESTGRTRDLYKWHPSLLYGPQHWILSREMKVPGSKRMERQWLRHSEVDLPCLDLGSDLVVYHRSLDRAKVRRNAQDGYYSAREQLKKEAVVAGSPADNGIGEKVKREPIRHR